MFLFTRKKKQPKKTRGTYIIVNFTSSVIFEYAKIHTVSCVRREKLCRIKFKSFLNPEYCDLSVIWFSKSDSSSVVNADENNIIILCFGKAIKI